MHNFVKRQTTTCSVVEGVGRSESNKSVVGIWSEHRLLVPHMGVLAELLNLGELELLSVLVSCHVVDSLSVLGSNIIDLSKELLLNDGVVDMAHHLGSV
jgi:hypothetical protein